MLWITMGLAILVTCGLHETIASLGMDAPGEAADASHSVYVAMCLTVLVLLWPLLMLEMMRGSHR